MGCGSYLNQNTVQDRKSDANTAKFTGGWQAKDIRNFNIKKSQRSKHRV
jgi:hypothetical protein